MAWWTLAGAIVLNAAANIFIKLGAKAWAGSSAPSALSPSLLVNPWLIGGILSFAAALLLYTITLRTWPLTLAYPLMTGVGFFIVSAVSMGLLHEVFSWSKVGAMATILVGIIWLARL